MRLSECWCEPIRAARSNQMTIASTPHGGDSHPWCTASSVYSEAMSCGSGICDHWPSAAVQVLNGNGTDSTCGDD